MEAKLMTKKALATLFGAYETAIGVLIRKNGLKPAGQAFRSGRGTRSFLYDADAVAALIEARGGFKKRRKTLPPLTGEQSALVVAFLADLEAKNQSARGILFAVYPSMARQASAFLAWDEIEAECLYGAVVAATDFKPGRAAFATYASMRMRAYVNAAIRSKRRMPLMPTHKNGDPVDVVCRRTDDPAATVAALDDFLHT